MEKLVTRAYDADVGAVSSIGEPAVALQSNFGFSPASGRPTPGAVAARRCCSSCPVPTATRRPRTGAGRGYRQPAQTDGVWRGGIDLVSQIDPTIRPELQYVVLLADQRLLASSATSSYAAVAGKAARGDAATLGSSVSELTGAPGSPANAMIWARDFACEDLAMSSADDDAQAESESAARESAASPR